MSWNGFKLGGVTAATLNILQLEGQSNPILPPTRDRLLEIPGMAGVYDFGTELAARRFSIPCAFIYAANREQLDQHIETLAAHLLDVNGVPRYMELIFESDPTRYYNVRYSGSLELSRVVFDGQFDLPLLAPNPYPQDVSEPT